MYPLLVAASGVVNQYYFYCANEEFGPVCNNMITWLSPLARATERLAARAGQLTRISALLIG